MNFIDKFIFLVESNSALISLVVFCLSIVPALVSLRSSFEALRSVRNLRFRIDGLENRYNFKVEGFKKEQMRQILQFIESYDKVDSRINIIFPDDKISVLKLFVEAFSELAPRQKAEVIEILRGENPKTQETIIRHIFDGPAGKSNEVRH